MSNEKTVRERNTDRVWQKKLLPFMVITLITLTIFFIVASYFEFRDFKSRLDSSSKPDEIKTIVDVSESIKDDKSLAFEYAKWRALVLLERDALNQRYNHSKTIILARMWTRYLGFLTGMILAIVGAVFVLGKLRESEAQLGAEAVQVKLSITSASPGLILSTLGTILILTTLIVKTDVSVGDGSIYLPSSNKSLNQAEPPDIDFGNSNLENDNQSPDQANSNDIRSTQQSPKKRK